MSLRGIASVVGAMGVLCVLLCQGTGADKPGGVGPRALLCYVASWHAKFQPRDLNPELCTMVMVAFGRLMTSQSGALVETDFALTDDPDKVSVGRIVALNSSTPIGMSIGGWGEGSERFSTVAADPIKRKAFVDSVLRVVNRWNLKGVELAWVAPTTRGGQKSDRENYVQLVAEMARALQALPTPVKLGVAIPVVTHFELMEGFDLRELAKHVDWFLVQGYDMHGHWESFSDVNAPLYSSRPGDNQTVSARISTLLDFIPNERLVLGMPAFGRTWTLADSPVPGGVGSRAEQGVMFGEGLMAYSEICLYVNAEEDDERKLIAARDPISKTPYAVSNRPTRRGFASYDDPQSIRDKVSFARNSGLAGVALFTVDNDDYLGECGTKYPLLKAAQQELQQD